MPPRSVNSICPVITVAEHLNRILAMVPVLEVEKAGLPEARGRFLASPVTAAIPVPPWTNSAMDGYAVRFDDLAGASQQSPVTLRVVGDLPAGTGEDPAIGPGEAVRIMTGAPVPAAADTVIPQEMTDGGLEEVRIEEQLPRAATSAGRARTGPRVIRSHRPESSFRRNLWPPWPRLASAR